MSGHTCTASFVLHILHELTVRPLRHLLVRLASQVDAILNIAHVSHGDVGHLLVLTKVDDLSAGLVENVALLTFELGRRLCLALLESLVSAGTRLTPAQTSVVGCVSLVTQAFHGTQVTTADHDALTFLCDDSGYVDLAQVYASRLDTPEQGGIDLAGINRDTQFVVIGPPGQFGLADVGILELDRELEDERLATSAIGENDTSILDLDGLILPGDGLIPLFLVGIAGLDFAGFRFSLAQFARRLDVGFELLSESLDGLGMERILTFEHRLQVVTRQPLFATTGDVDLDHIRPATPSLTAQMFALLFLRLVEPQGYDSHNIVGFFSLVGHMRSLQKNTFTVKFSKAAFHPHI